MAGNLTKEKIGKEDLNIQETTAAAVTWNRTSSTGGTVTMTKIPDLWGYTGALRPGDIITKGPWHDIRAYGCLTSAADNSTNMQTAATAAAGAILFIPEGAWNIGSTVNISSGTTVMGVGKLSRVVASSSLGDNPLFRNLTIAPANNAARDSGITFTQLQMDGNRTVNTGATQFAHCLRLTAVADTMVHDCWFVSPKGDGILIDIYTTGPIYGDDIIISNNKFYDCNRNGIADTGGSRHLFQGNLIDTTNVAHGIDIEPDGDYITHDISIIGNIIKGSFSSGIALSPNNVTTATNKRNFIVANNNIISPSDSTYGHGIYLNASPSPTIVTGNQLFDCAVYGIFGEATSHDAVIQGNIVYQAANYGIYLTGDRFTCSNNYVFADANAAFFISSSDGGVISGNTVYVNGNFNGIHLYQTNDILINGNFLRGDGAGASHGIGIRGATDTASAILGNRVDLFTTGVQVDADCAATTTVNAHNNATGCGTAISDLR